MLFLILFIYELDIRYRIFYCIESDVGSLSLASMFQIRLNGLVSPLLMPNLQKCNHHQATAFSDASAAATTAATSTTLTIPNSYALVDTPTSTSLLLQQVQRPNILSQVCFPLQCWLYITHLKKIIKLYNFTLQRIFKFSPSAAICNWGHLTSRKCVERVVGGDGEISLVHRDTLRYQNKVRIQ